MEEIINAYDPGLPLDKACTPPASWYIDEAFAKHENETVFGRNWLVAGRCYQLKNEGDYLATDLAGQPVILVKSDKVRAFYNVCRHHAAEIKEAGTGCAKILQCPYHGWTYGLDGKLKGAPQFGLAENFDKNDHGLVPVQVDTWENWIFVCFDDEAEPLRDFLGALYDKIRPFRLNRMKFHKSVCYDLDCNWKVFVDNYLDGGYHVPVLHDALNGALDCRDYQISTEDRYCLQDCPTSESGDDVSAVRSGERAYYYWLYPNLMINLYEGVMDTNLVVPVSSKRCRVYFDYYFGDDPKFTDEVKNKSVEVAHQIQLEDEMICHSVQRGLASWAYDSGRLSPEKEAGEHLFHRLLHADLIRPGKKA